MKLLSALDLDTSSIPYIGPLVGRYIATLEPLLPNILLNLCGACEELMASIPPSAFSAARIRETQRGMKVSNIKKWDESIKFYQTQLMELTPLKYNSKLMNSIWGLYNRYSPHNVKNVNDVSRFNTELQQSAVNSTNKNDAMISLPAAKLDNVWATISQ